MEKFQKTLESFHNSIKNYKKYGYYERVDFNMTSMEYFNKMVGINYNNHLNINEKEVLIFDQLYNNCTHENILKTLFMLQNENSKLQYLILDYLQRQNIIKNKR